MRQYIKRGSIDNDVLTVDLVDSRLARRTFRFFRVAFDVELVEIPIINEFVRLTLVEEGRTPEDGSGVWSRNENALLFLEPAVFAKFTVADSAASGNQPPTADAGAPVTGVVDVAVAFDGTASGDPDGTVASYEWDFGDDNTGSGAMPNHTYAAPGIYIVSLTVTDDAGTTDSGITAAAIDADNQPPLADAGGPYTCMSRIAA